MNKFKKIVSILVILSMLLSMTAGFPAFSATSPLLPAAKVQTEAFNPIAWYDFDNGIADAKVVDKSGNGNDLNVFGSSNTALVENRGNVLDLNGTSGSYASLPATMFDGIESMTFSTFINVRLNSSTNWARVFDFNNNSGGSSPSAFLFLTNKNGATNVARLVYDSGDTASPTRVGDYDGPSTLSNNTFVHVAFTVTGSTMRFYINGEMVTQSVNATPINEYINKITNYYIGRSGFSADSYMNAQYDDMRIYNRALTPTEMKKVANGEILTETFNTISINDNTVGTGYNQFNYAPSRWSNWTDASATSLKYQKDDSWSGAQDAYYTIKFNGVQTKIYCATAPNHGIAAVSIDGGEETLVDLYTTTRIDQNLVYTSPMMTSGEHLLKVRVPGLKNAASSGTTVTADRVDIIQKEDSKIIDALNTIELPASVISKLNLPTVTLGLPVVWTSKTPDLIDNEGKVLLRGATDATAIMTASITYLDISYTKDFSLKIPAASQSAYSLAIDGANKGVDIGQDMIGLFFEDINYGADGGLYAELIQNRSFEFFNTRYNSSSTLSMYGWSFVNGIGTATGVVSKDSPLNDNNENYMRLTVTNEDAGISNSGYGGISLEKDKNYNFSMYLRNVNNPGKYVVSLEKDGVYYAYGEIPKATDEWTKSTVVLTSNATVSNANLVIRAVNEGTVDMDMISLFPENTFNNRENGLRADMVQALKDINPGFLRFPGGCIVEGYNLENRYQWKNTVGPVEERITNWNRWQSWGYPEYFQSNGLGFYEYFLLCEDIGAKPLPILNCGMACQYETGELVPLDQLQPYVQDALDLIEFCNGSTDTVWGALRAEMGHPEPFNLEYLGIGNEQWGTEYFKRYDIFQAAIEKAYPNIKLVSSSGPSSDGTDFTNAWKIFNQKDQSYAYAIDEHYYKSPDWFFSNTTRYDNYNRNAPLVFAGEYASHIGNIPRPNNMLAALSEAAFMTGLERNADVVKLASYAPLFAKLGSTQWSPDLIWVNNTQVYGSPSYYVQQMYGQNIGDYTLKSDIKSATTISESGKIGVGSWDTAVVYDDVKVVSNADNTVLFEDNFTDGISNWSGSTAGTWAVTNGELVQSATSGATTGNNIYAGNANWTDYTLTLKAKKTAGAEGFLIPFLVKDTNNFYHWNIGGWNNVTTVLEKAANGVKSNYGASVALGVNLNQWYDIKVVVTDTNIQCYLDGKLIHAVSNYKLPVYSNTSFDKETGDIIVKIVNNTNSEQDVKVNIADIDYINPKGKVIELQSDDTTTVNSISNPKAAVAITKDYSDFGKDFVYVTPKIFILYPTNFYKKPIRSVSLVLNQLPLSPKKAMQRCFQHKYLLFTQTDILHI